MEKQILRITKIENVAYNVLSFTLKNSGKISFVPGQAAELAIDKEGWREKGNPFTFTSLPSEEHIEFTIKIYPDHKGVTNELSKLNVGDKIILKSVFGAIEYKGKGTFIAGGAGITPFISIFRDLNQKKEIAGNRLIFANSKKRDIINQKEFNEMLGEDFLNILSREEIKNYAHGRIDLDYLKNNITHLDDFFYICGPEAMMDAVEESLKELGVGEDKIVKEVFN